MPWRHAEAAIQFLIPEFSLVPGSHGRKLQILIRYNHKRPESLRLFGDVGRSINGNSESQSGRPPGIAAALSMATWSHHQDLPAFTFERGSLPAQAMALVDTPATEHGLCLKVTISPMRRFHPKLRCPVHRSVRSKGKNLQPEGPV